MPRPKPKSMLFLMPIARIKYAEIEEVVRLRGEIDRQTKRLHRLGHGILSKLQKGIGLEPGSIPVEVETVEEGSALITRLVVDGRPL